MRLNGKNILVTGSGRGFGRAMAISYAAEGARIISVARSKNELNSAKKAMKKHGAEVLTVRADLATDKGISKVYEETIDTFGGLDVLVNNAATSPWLTIDEMTMRHWDTTLAVNLRAPFALAKAFYPSMEERGGGSVINVTSRSAETGFVAEIAYCPSKYGLEGLTQCLALELKPRNIAVNSLNVASPPGMRLKPTELTLQEAANMPNEVKDKYADDESMVQHFTDAWVFVAQQDGEGITGQRLSTRELAKVLQEEGEEAAIERWKGKMVDAIYTPRDWPKSVRYQTPDGGWKGLVY
ncbi:MAG: SDR family oxidoreductase [Candidatus Bathyarchaeota archaeon]|nr:SDR family oxidoreductase [Candidatus Bathyarchaeota archaeon]